MTTLDRPAYPVLRLHRERQASATFHHPWIFSGALDEPIHSNLHGQLVHVASSDGRIVGTGTYSATSSIAVRLFSFGLAQIDQSWLETKIAESDARRRLLGYGPGTQTTGYRAVFAESDGLPGLVVDRYGDSVVFQISTAGMEALRDGVLAALRATFQPASIVERSDLPVRREERLQERVETHFGTPPDRAPFVEFGAPFLADPLHGQKTGFFLDQKELRLLVRQTVEKLPQGSRSVLNLFSYGGATGIAAMLGGADRVHNVDGSEQALDYCREHIKLHALDEARFTLERADVFQWLSAQPAEAAYDVVVLDPPALIKSQRDSEQGRRAYHFLNRGALRLLRDGGLLVTSSCSHFLTEDDLAFEIRRAAASQGVTLHTIRTLRQSPDHPLSVTFPEAAYLKSFVCQVRRDESVTPPAAFAPYEEQAPAAPTPAEPESAPRPPRPARPRIRTIIRRRV